MPVNKLRYKIFGWTGLFLPFLAVAQYGNETVITSRIVNLETVFRTFIGLLFALATVIFLWGIILYIRSSADEAGRRKAQGIMTWGIIGLTVMVVAWGIVTIIISYFGIPNAPPGRIGIPVY